jgi:hypothetical protein
MKTVKLHYSSKVQDVLEKAQWRDRNLLFAKESIENPQS